MRGLDDARKRAHVSGRVRACPYWGVLGICLGALALPPLVGCGGAAPAERAERGLYEDLRRVVEHEQRSGSWVIDRYAVEHQADTTLASACRTTPATRVHLDGWLARHIAALGGPSEDAYVRRGRDLGAVEDIRFYERVRMLLHLAIERGPSECPYWLEPDPDFSGVQTNNHGFGLVLESIGSGALLIQDGHVDLGGSAGGRVMPAWAFSPSVLVAIGPELGGTGSFPTDTAGDRQLVAVFAIGVPVLLRVRNGTQHFDFEVAAMNRFTENDFPFAPSLRFSIGYGLSTIRSGGFLPTGGLWVGYQITPAHGTALGEHAILLGTRVGLDWRP